jgi:hypothetical protein
MTHSELEAEYQIVKKQAAQDYQDLCGSKPSSEYKSMSRYLLSFLLGCASYGIANAIYQLIK